MIMEEEDAWNNFWLWEKVKAHDPEKSTFYLFI